MRLKSYFVHSVEEAIQQAKSELGSEAMLVDAKSLAAQSGNRARVEVIFAAPTQAPAAPPVISTPIVPMPSRRPAAVADQAAFQRFRGGLTSLLTALNDAPGNGHLEEIEFGPGATDWLAARLASAEISRPLIGQLLANDFTVSTDSKSPETLAASLLEARIAQPTDVATEARRIALVGPTGGGKTSVTAKLAYQLGIEKGISPLVLSLDNIKIGASDQIGRLCRLLGVAFHAIENPGELRIVLEENEHRRLILIDTPGLHAGYPYLAADLAACMAGTVPVERHLVIPAPARSATMETWLDQAEALSIGHLLFTRMDETELFGPIWSVAAARKIPLSWMSLGPRIPEDLEPANVPRLCSTIAGFTSTPFLPRANAARAGSSHFS